MQTLTIFYDAQCGLCGRFRRWMCSQESMVRLEFLPYDSAEARARLPELEALGAEREIVVMSDAGEVWQGAGAWVTCLWTLREWRAWAVRLASPALLPVAANACHLISQNRLGLSRLLSLRSDRELAEACEEEPEPCASGTCGIGPGRWLGAGHAPGDPEIEDDALTTRSFPDGRPSHP